VGEVIAWVRCVRESHTLRGANETKNETPDDINFLGRYAFTRADASTGLRPFHDPSQDT
jgi:hypothetical protein